MNCKKCGTPLGPNDLFCKECGTSVDVLVPGTPGVTPVTTAPTTPVATETPTQPVTQPATPVIPAATTVVQTPVVPGQPVMQTVPMQQMGYSQPMMMQQPAPKKTSKILIIVTILVVIAAVAVVLYFTVLKKDDKKPNNSNSNNTQQNSGSNSNIPSTIDTNTNVQPNSNVISYEGFTYQVPTGYIAQVSELEGAVVLQKGSLTVGLVTLDGQYETLLSNIAGLKPNFESMGYTNVIVAEQTVNGKSYIVGTVELDGEKIVVAYTKANAYITFGVEIHMADNSYGTAYLSEIDNILSTATFDSTSRGTDITNIDSLLGM